MGWVVTISFLLYWVLDCNQFCFSLTFLLTFLIWMLGWNCSCMSKCFFILNIWRSLPFKLVILDRLRPQGNLLSWHRRVCLILNSIVVYHVIIIVIKVAIVSIHQKLVHIHLSIRWVLISIALSTNSLAVLINRPCSIELLLQILHLEDFVVVVPLHALVHIFRFPLNYIRWLSCSNGEVLPGLTLTTAIGSLGLARDTITNFDWSSAIIW